MAEQTPSTESGANEALHLNAGDGDSLTLPEGFDLTSAEFKVEGDDLIVTAPDGSQVVIEDYYAQASPPQLTTPGGAQLSGEMVAQLAEGPVSADVSGGTDGATTQGGSEGMIAANPSVITGTDGEPIGNVENLSGHVFAIRADGSRVELNVGDPVYQGDILESSGDGSIGVLLADETTFSMGENGRMVLDEMIYDPSTQEGSVSMTALQGVFTFVSGQVAKTDPDAMTLDTPVATIGIRGTQVGLDISDGQKLDVVLMEEADGFVGEVVVMNDAGVQVLNGANQMTGITGFQAAPTTVSVMTQATMVQQYDAPLRHLPIIHGNQNDFGLQKNDDGQFLDKEIEQLQEVNPEELANFETAAGQAEQENATPDILPVSGELEQLTVLDPLARVTAVEEIAGTGSTGGSGASDNNDDDEIISNNKTIEIPAGKQLIAGPGGEPLFVPEEIKNAVYNSETGKVEGDVEGDLIVDDSDENSYDLTASDGDNIITTGKGGDYIRGSDGDDTLSGGSGDDTLEGGQGDDIIMGGDGNDLIIAGSGDGNDTYIGGDGIDEVSYAGVGAGMNLVVNLSLGQATSTNGVWIDLDTLEGIENISGSQGGDVIIGSADNNVLDGGAGDDTISGGYGDDVLIGGAGNNLLIGGHGFDQARFDGALSNFDIQIVGDEFVVVNQETGEKTALRGIEKMVFEDADGE